MESWSTTPIRGRQDDGGRIATTVEEALASLTTEMTNSREANKESMKKKNDSEALEIVKGPESLYTVIKLGLHSRRTKEKKRKRKKRNYVNALLISVRVIVNVLKKKPKCCSITRFEQRFSIDNTIRKR
ncbi:hypothetical protein APICC_09195 [Apis cerana cerana]|uniref:Uncharacterized protein n=1 Tax=Apis cerana cerana TaxID=94128 RepID=A0A2A3EHI5_APICC|nr:hypothetical protein APICC_09195 [Apis cerana cerana]